jgi:hypothetical protein
LLLLAENFLNIRKSKINPNSRRPRFVNQIAAAMPRFETAGIASRPDKVGGWFQMSSIRFFVVLSLILVSASLSAALPCRRDTQHFSFWEPLLGRAAVPTFTERFVPDLAGGQPQNAVRKPAEIGIKEVVPKSLRGKYEKWKEELLSTEFGRQQWDLYASRKDFLLTIVVTKDKRFGAGTDGYEWNDDGDLVAATITLGKELDKGYPDPIYYPVMNSLSTYNEPYQISGNILASTKLAHEIGHVNFTAKVNSILFQRQNKLMASYYKIFLHNGYDTSDPRLVELAKDLGADPIDIWEDREYWSEVNAMHYLAERINKEFFYCSVFNRIRRNVSNYARNYQDRFEQVADANGPANCHS